MTISQFCYSTILSLKTIPGHPEGIVNIQYQHLCVYQDLYVCISTDFSSSLAIEMSVPSLHREYYRTL